MNSFRILAVACIASSLNTPCFCQYSQKPPDSDNVSFAFQNKSTYKWGFVNPRGEVTIIPRFDYAMDFSEGLALVHQERRVFCIDPSGKEVFRLPDGTRRALPVTEGMVWYLSPARKWGLSDSRGRIIVEPKYDDVRAFSENRACVNVGATPDFGGGMFGGKWGFVSTTGEVVVPFDYMYANDFSEGLAKVIASIAGPTRFIDSHGVVKLTIPVDRGVCGDFHEGLAPVSDSTRTEYIDKLGEVQFQVPGYAEEFHEGLAVIEISSAPRDSSYGYINKQGKVAIGVRFAHALPFSEGLAAVSTQSRKMDGGKWGYIDTTGEFVIEPRFNYASRFRNGLTKVHIGGELENALGHEFVWRGGAWLWIDRTGRVFMRL